MSEEIRMKARIVKPQELVLYYPKGNEKIAEVLKRLDVPVRLLSDSELEQTVAECLKGGQKELESTVSERLPEAFLLFSGVAEKRFQTVLNELRPAAPHLIKAVVTQHNSSWKVSELFEELCRERESLGVHQK